MGLREELEAMSPTELCEATNVLQMFHDAYLMDRQEDGVLDIIGTYLAEDESTRYGILQEFRHRVNLQAFAASAVGDDEYAEALLEAADLLRAEKPDKTKMTKLVDKMQVKREKRLRIENAKLDVDLGVVSKPSENEALV